MERSFYIKEERLAELKLYIKELTPSVRFKSNPIKAGDNKLLIDLTLTVHDSNILNVLFNKWHAKDNPVIKKIGWKDLLLKRLNLS